MALPKNTLWKFDPHTLGKHLVLRSYLNAWFPILGSWKNRILFIDGFAGPGEYEDGEEGSPQIAMRALVDHSAKIGADVGFLFIEKDEERAKHLSEVVERWKAKLPGKSQAAVITGQFDDTMEEVFEDLDEKNKRLASAFVMIDPFGVSGTPMSVVERVLKNRQCEVFVSLMYEAINRFKNSKEFPDHLDELFGCGDWRECVDIEDSEKRRKCFYNLYERQLRAAGAKYVVHFDLYEGRRLIYSIFFATGHELGCDRMKQAIWKITPEGGCEFRGTHTGQLTLGLEPDFDPLKRQLHERFGNGEWYQVEQFETFMKSDATDYHSGQLRKGALVPLEVGGFIEVDPTTRKRKNTYPKGCKLRFKKN
ncbi:MAG: three-Cys-motif partner protein TcmP [Proteobacteria bacterium]|nr:three-Cys-motif partner protein TcmP [Pseudomonadota bacterium]